MDSRADYVLKLSLYKILQGIRCLNSSKIHIFKAKDLISTYLVFWNCPSKLILMKFLCLRTFIFWPYVVPRPKFGLAAPLIYRGHNKNQSIFGPFGSNPKCLSSLVLITLSLWNLPVTNAYLACIKLSKNVYHYILHHQLAWIVL